MAKKLITERDILDRFKKGEKILHIDVNTMLTPSAKDAAVQHDMQIKFSQDPVNARSSKVDAIALIPSKVVGSPHASTVIAMGSDHGGFRLKETLKQYVAELGFTIADVGTSSEDTCDYPDFAYAVAAMVSSGEASRGIMIDGVGVASSIVANKVPGVRAVPCYDEFVARSSREHNDANVLTLGGRIVGSELAKAIVRIWLETEFGGGRHQGRVQKISDVEKRFTRQ